MANETEASISTQYKLNAGRQLSMQLSAAITKESLPSVMVCRGMLTAWWYSPNRSFTPVLHTGPGAGYTEWEDPCV